MVALHGVPRSENDSKFSLRWRETKWPIFWAYLCSVRLIRRFDLNSFRKYSGTILLARRDFCPMVLFKGNKSDECTGKAIAIGVGIEEGLDYSNQFYSGEKTCVRSAFWLLEVSLCRPQYLCIAEIV